MRSIQCHSRTVAHWKVNKWDWKHINNNNNGEKRVHTEQSEPKSDRQMDAQRKV